MRVAWLAALGGAAMLAGCKKLEPDLANFVCDNGRCEDGYACHPERDLCVPAITVSCSGDGTCPTTTNTGDTCPSEGSFLPCLFGINDCQAGCRTCENGLWSACTPAACNLGQVTSCASCTDNCAASVAHASAICNTTGPATCDYTICDTDFVDRDGVRATGCECGVTNGGVELPGDGIDQNCDGVDDCYQDLDNDNLGSSAVVQDTDLDCSNGAGTATVSGDCNDNNPACGSNCGACFSCSAGDTFTLDAVSDCAAGATDVTVMTIVASTTCDNLLQTLTLERHPASNTLDAQLANLRLYRDVDASGTLTAGDTLLGGPVNMSGGVITFPAVGLLVNAGTPETLLLVADAAGASYFAARLVNNTSFTLADSDETRVLARTPLDGGAHSMANRLCTGAGAEEPTDLGVGSQRVAGVQAINGPGNGAWSSGTGGETGWSVVGGDNGSQSADCDLATSGTTPARTRTRDRGNQTVYLHIDSGVPLGLPLCGLTMRMYGSRLRPGTTICEFSLFGETPLACSPTPCSPPPPLPGHSQLYLLAYSGAAAVNAASQRVDSIAATVGPDTAACGTDGDNDFVDVDLTAFYNGASGTSTLNIRLIPEWGGGIDVDDSATAEARITSIPEIYIRANP